MKTDMFTPVVSPNAPMTALGRLSRAGYIHHKTGYLPWRVLGQYALVYVLEGEGKYQDTNGFQSPIAAGDMLLLFPELAHRYGPGRSGTWAEFHVIFEGKPFDAWREAGILEAAQPIFSLQPVEEWAKRLAAITQIDQRTVAIARLLAFLTEATATRTTNSTAPPVPWLNHARHLLATDLNEDLVLPEIAQQLGVSYETFRKTFERQTHVSPARYRAMKRLDAARALLLHTPMTSRQIVDSLGYPDEFYFSKWFKQMAGQSPREYRQRSEPRKDDGD